MNFLITGIVLSAGLMLHANINQIEAKYREAYSELKQKKIGIYIDGRNSLRVSVFAPIPEKLFDELEKLSPIITDFSYLVSERRDVRGLSFLRKCTNLVNLSVEGGAIDDSFSFIFKDMLVLKEVSLSNCDVGDETVKNMASSMNLELINLSGSKVTDASAIVFVRMKKLRSLNLSNSRITDYTLLEFTKAQFPLTRIILDGTKITEKGVVALLKNHNIEYLSIIGCGLSTRVVNTIKAEFDKVEIYNEADNGVM